MCVRFFSIRLKPLCSCLNNVITLLVQSKDVPSQRKLGQKGNSNPNKFLASFMLFSVNYAMAFARPLTFAIASCGEPSIR